MEELSGFDFGQYSFSSLKRRIERLLKLYNLETIHALIIALKDDSELLKVVINEITVNTTELFRDPEMWVNLKEQVKLISQVKSQIGLRIWHAACSRGDEVFSMLIILNELSLLNDAKISASDINYTVLENAKQGKMHISNYERNKKNMQHVFPKMNFEKYFTEFDGTHYYFDKSVLRYVNFKSHNLDRDEVFGLFDIVMCRNVLIYFNLELQDKVLHNLLEATKTHGLLVIGSKESLSWSKVAKQVTTLSMAHKIYKKKHIF
jgi:chemotaxis protein methyltransferase CheR